MRSRSQPASSPSIDAVVAGHHDVGGVAVATLLAGGNLLIEDIPGVGKTLLAQVIARAVGGSFGRIQGTPDLLPGRCHRFDDAGPRTATA